MKSSAVARLVGAAFPRRQGWACVVDADFRLLDWVELSRPDADETIERLAARDGRARIYVSTFRSPTNRRTENVLESRLAMVDADGTSAYLSADPSPGIVLASRTPGNAHALWATDWSMSGSEASEINRGLSGLLGGDSGFRLGVNATVWLPRDDDDLLVYEPGGVANRRELRRHRNSAAPKPPEAPARTPADRKASVAMAVGRALNAVAQGDSRNSTGWRLAGDLRSRGLTEDEAVQAGESYVAEVELAKVGDDPYTIQEWRDQVRRHFEHGAVLVDPEHVERVDVWETGWLTNRRYGSSQKTLVSAVAGLARAAGSDQVMLSRRKAMIFARLSRGAVDRGFDGSKTRDGLIGTALELRAKPRRGSREGSILQLLDPPSPPIATPLSPPLGLVLSPLVFPSQTVPPNHDAFRITGHGPRLVLDVLLGLARPASIAELAGSPVLSDHKRTIRRQLQRLQELGLVTRSDDALWQPVDDLEVVLDLVAEQTERPNGEGRIESWSERTHRQHERERAHYEDVLEDSKRREGDRLRRVLRRERGRSPRLRRPLSKSRPRFGFTRVPDPALASKRLLRSRPRTPTSPRRTIPTITQRKSKQ